MEQTVNLHTALLIVDDLVGQLEEFTNRMINAARSNDAYPHEDFQVSLREMQQLAITLSSRLN